MPLNVPFFEIAPLPVYQRIAPKARSLNQLGLNYAAIARRLGVAGKTVAKAIRWHRL